MANMRRRTRMIEKLERPVLKVAQLSCIMGLSANCMMAWLSSSWFSFLLNQDPILVYWKLVEVD